MVDAVKNKQNDPGLVGKVYIGLLLVILGGIVLHAPLSVGFGTLWPSYSLLIKSWKEILMLVAGLLALFLMYRHRQFGILRNPIIVLISLYALLHLILLPFNFQGLTASVAGLAIDLRYFLYFGLVFIAVKMYPSARELFIKVAIAGSLVVLIFAMLQVFVLPPDVLKYIGYNVNTISPYLTIDKNQAFVRINSTLRGPNPLGAYAIVALTSIIAAVAMGKVTTRRSLALVGVLSAGSVVALWASYSRSALIGMAIAIVIVLGAVYSRKLSRKSVAIIGLAVILAIGGLFSTRNTSFVSNVLLHENPSGGSSVNSNEGHASSLSDGLNNMLHQPLGSGIGSTGSASILNNKSYVIENQYLFEAHEAGWFGLALFLSVFGLVLSGLWKLRKSWFALSIFASGIGLAVVGLFLPVWVDDTVSIIWWGLAAVALCSDSLFIKQHKVL